MDPLPPEDRRLLHDLLGAVGSVHEVPAADLPYYSALCSAGPALYATMMEMIADVMAAHKGYDRQFCRSLVRETFVGTAALQDQDRIDASEVVSRVAHPGGPSERGVAFLKDRFPTLVENMLAAMAKW